MQCFDNINELLIEKDKKIKQFEKDHEWSLMKNFCKSNKEEYDKMVRLCYEASERFYEVFNDE